MPQSHFWTNMVGRKGEVCPQVERVDSMVLICSVNVLSVRLVANTGTLA
jgi:hypothetical protein